jgi:hypothetical protein
MKNRLFSGSFLFVTTFIGICGCVYFLCHEYKDTNPVLIWSSIKFQTETLPDAGISPECNGGPMLGYD